MDDVRDDEASCEDALSFQDFFSLAGLISIAGGAVDVLGHSFLNDPTKVTANINLKL